MSDIDALSRSAYASGTDPVDWACTLAELQIDALQLITAARADNPAAYPVFQMELSPAATARRVVGLLLDAGWTPPAATQEAS